MQVNVQVPQEPPAQLNDQTPETSQLALTMLPPPQFCCETRPKQLAAGALPVLQVPLFEVGLVSKVPLAAPPVVGLVQVSMV